MFESEVCDIYYGRLVFMTDLELSFIGTVVHPLPGCEIGILFYCDFLPLPHKNKK